ncbi:unnamed protein product [Choristocarpus tenellus]
MLEDPVVFGLTSPAAFPSSLKISPGILKYDDGDGNHRSDVASNRLTTTHGDSMALDGMIGLNFQVSPGISSTVVEEWQADLASPSLDLHSLKFWSDPVFLDEGIHCDHPGGKAQVREWTQAVKVVHDLSSTGGVGVGQMCGWNKMKLRIVSGSHIVVTDLNHLMPGGDSRSFEKEIEGGLESKAEAQMGCLMTLISYLSSRPEVMLVTPEIEKRTLNAVATAITQSATITNKPLTLAGLDGTGEVIQVRWCIDETSCFFANGDGTEIEYGYYFDEIYWEIHGNYHYVNETVFTGGNFTFDLSRRKLVQYIDLYKSNFSEDFVLEQKDGHRTHVAGSEAGSTLNSPAAVVECDVGEELACSGKCITSFRTTNQMNNSFFNLDTYCPDYDCDGANANSLNCLGNDWARTLSEHAGMAPGAKLAVFDASHNGLFIYADPRNGLWEAANNTRAKIHTNSWGYDSLCQMIHNDKYLYENPDSLLLFAAGNGGYQFFYNRACTVWSPALGKNALSVGASSSGETRATPADINTRAFFSSYGPTMDNRIKSDVLAPGDQVFSASADGLDSHSCQLTNYIGTSMSTPIVAGAAALVRQYFKNETFYVNDFETRGVCQDGSPFQCEAFSPSGATVKAILINSANLMGGDSEPNGFTGFGWVHLEAGLPLNGDGNHTLFVADSLFANVYSGRNDTYEFEMDESGVEIRATLTWMDPEADEFSFVQLLNDLDLTVTSPSGEDFVMWSSGEVDKRNVVERVIVPAVLVEEGVWTVMVSANQLITEMQPCSLVVLGSISTVTVVEGENFPSADFSASLSLFGVYSQTAWVSTAVALVFASLFGLYGPALQGN